MRIPRIFFPESLIEGESLELKEDIAHRLLHVLRLKVGHKLFLFNGDGQQVAAEIIACAKKRVTILLKQTESLEARESKLRLHLVQAISKNDKMDFAIQKACELGVHTITPLVTEYTHLKQSQSVYESKWLHYRKVAIHAVEQCGRAVVPEVYNVTTFHQFMQQPFTKPVYFLSPRGESVQFSRDEQVVDVTLMVGCEGGFSAQEESLMLEKGAQPLRLGPRILRTETAPIAVLTLLQYFWGDLGV